MAQANARRDASSDPQIRGCTRSDRIRAMFPGAHIIGSNESNPQPWLTKDEWKHLLDVARARVDDAPNVRTKQQRRELRDFILFMHATALRVGEALSLQVRDCTPQMTEPREWSAIPAVAVPANRNRSRGLLGEEVEYRRVSAEEAESRIRYPYLMIQLRRSKTGKKGGPRRCQSRAYGDRVFRRLAKGKAATDPLFAEHQRRLPRAADRCRPANQHPRPSAQREMLATERDQSLVDRPADDPAVVARGELRHIHHDAAILLHQTARARARWLGVVVG
jgi:integrase